jgi:hypothetical protein
MSISHQIPSAFHKAASREIPFKEHLTNLWRRTSGPSNVRPLPEAIRRQAGTALDRIAAAAPPVIFRRHTIASRRLEYIDTAILFACGFVLLRAAEEMFRSGKSRIAPGKARTGRDVAGLDAAHEYNRDAQSFAHSGKVQMGAQEAKDALDGSEAESLKQAEDAGKQRRMGEDPT